MTGKSSSEHSARYSVCMVNSKMDFLTAPRLAGQTVTVVCPNVWSINKTEIPREQNEKQFGGGMGCSFERGETADEKEILAEDCHPDIKRVSYAAFCRG